MGKSGNPAKRAELEAALNEDDIARGDMPAGADTAPAADEHGTEDFDAFWAARKRKRRRTMVMGQELVLPPAIPLQFEMEAQRLERSQSEDDIKAMVGILVGPDALDGWIKAGLDAEQFAVLLAWLPQAIAGTGVTLAEVADAIEAAQQEASADPR